MEFVEKKCPVCWALLRVDCEMETTVCQYCRTTIIVKRTPPQSEVFEVFSEDLANNLANQIAQKMKPKKSAAKKVIIIVIISIFAIIILFVSCGLLGVFDRRPSLPATLPPIAPSAPRAWAEEHGEVHVYMPGEPLIFNDFEVTVFDDYIEFWEMNDADSRIEPSSPLYGGIGIYLPITVTNLLDETRSFSHHSIDVYSPDGLIQFRNITTPDASNRRIDRVGNFRGGATSDDRYLHLIFEGNGYYYISFSYWSEGEGIAREVKIWIER